MPTGNPLAELIDAIRTANDWSDEDVARRARAAGHDLKKSNISRIRNNPIKSLSPAFVFALAEGLSTSVTEVLRACLQTLDLPVSAPAQSPEQAIRSDPTLVASQREMLIAAVRAAREANKAEQAIRFTPSDSEDQVRQKLRDAAAEGLIEFHDDEASADASIARFLAESGAQGAKPTDLSSRRKGPGLGQPPADVAARPVTDPSQLVDPDE